MAKPQVVTSISENPEDERKRRMIRYTVAMSIRVVCLILGVAVQGPLMWFFFAGAIFLPYFAVVLANTQGQSSRTRSAAAISIPLSNDSPSARNQ